MSTPYNPFTPIHRAPASVWQPIETAPKDGTDLLLYGCVDGSPDEPEFGVGYWHRFYHKWVLGGPWQGFVPTHWTHLPAPPQ